MSLIPSAKSRHQIQTEEEEKPEGILDGIITNDSNRGNDDIDYPDEIEKCDIFYNSFQDEENDFGILDAKKNFGFFLNALFEPIITNFVENSSIYPSDEIFINSEMISNCHLLSKFYKYLFPTATFRFEIEPKNIKFDEFIDILPNDMIIAFIERGCTLVTIAFITLEITKEENTIFFNEINQIYEKLNSSNGHHIAGKVSSKPEVHFPRDFNINNDLNGQIARNIIFEKDFFTGDNYKSIKKSIKKFINKKKKKDWKLIFDHFELFQEAEEEIRNNIENNEFEMTVIDQTIIPSNYFQNYEKIKKEILKKILNDSEKFERFLYHGTRFSNHRKIIKEHFEDPYSKEYSKKVQVTDKSYFGKGIYATDNIFYASLYGNNYRQMKPNDIASVFCCLSIHNPEYAKDIKDDVDEELVAGKPLPEEIINNYGIHRVLVGDKKSYHVIQKEEIIDSNLVAYEFVFPNNYQIIPIFSFKVMRSDFYILWADENGKHIKYSNDLRKNVAENIYYSSDGAAITEIVERKKKNKIKLIISYENPDSARSIIEGVRDCYGSDIVCLIFSTDEKQIKFAESIENVIFTNNFDDVIRYSQLPMSFKNFGNYIKELEEKYKTKFAINDLSILDFKHLENLQVISLKPQESKKKWK